MATLITPKILEPIGFKKHEAVVLSYLINMKKTISRDIEHACNLRQPEACLALRSLTEDGFVKYIEKKSPGKGRPVHIYSVNGKILDLLDLKLGQKQKELSSDIKKLDEISRIIKRRQKEQSQKKMNA